MRFELRILAFVFFENTLLIAFMLPRLLAESRPNGILVICTFFPEVSTSNSVCGGVVLMRFSVV